MSNIAYIIYQGPGKWVAELRGDHDALQEIIRSHSREDVERRSRERGYPAIVPMPSALKQEAS